LPVFEADSKRNNYQEKNMRLIVRQSEKDAAAWAAQYIQKQKGYFDALASGRPFVLGLPTGSSPVLVYRELAALHKANRVSFDNVVTFNMDEYAGLPADHPQSYHTFMREHLFSAIKIDERRVHILDGCAKDLAVECAAYEKAIKDAGGIDLFLCGMGENGHLAFNEPGSSMGSRTRVIALTQNTREVNARFFANINEVPTQALSVGIGTVMDAREIVVIVTGTRKAAAVAACVEGPVSQGKPLSFLQLHPNVTIVCDEAAASDLKYGTVMQSRAVEQL
jgi:glucosamine-6-phosphate deaminase